MNPTQVELLSERQEPDNRLASVRRLVAEIRANERTHKIRQASRIYEEATEAHRGRGLPHVNPHD